MGTGAAFLPFPSSHIHALTATLEGAGHSPTRVNKKSTDFRANGVEPSWREVKAVRTTALQAGATISPISGRRTLRHMGLGEPLKHTLAAEPGSWIPGLPLSPQPGFSTVLIQNHPSCTHADVVGAGGRRARGGTAGPCGVVLSRRGPTALVGWGQPAFSDREGGGQLVLIWGGVHPQPLFQEGGPRWGAQSLQLWA